DLLERPLRPQHLLGQPTDGGALEGEAAQHPIHGFLGLRPHHHERNHITLGFWRSRTTTISRWRKPRPSSRTWEQGSPRSGESAVGRSRTPPTSSRWSRRASSASNEART